LIEHNAILAKDNLAKRNWSGDLRCRFCSDLESIDHLFFECLTAKYIWSLVAFVLGATHRPTSFGQFWHWIAIILPNRKQFHMIGLTAICWAILTARNNSCFEKKSIGSPTKIVCSISSFLNYWAGLQSGQNKEDLEAGAKSLLKAALHFHTKAAGDDAGMVLLQ